MAVIENYKGIVKTGDGDQIIGAFRYPRLVPEAALQSPLTLSISRTEHIFIEIHDEDRLGVVVHQQRNGKPDIEVDAIYVRQHPDLRELSLSYPATTMMGPGSGGWNVPGNKQNEWKGRLDSVISAIFKLDYEASGKAKKRTLDYVKFMQVARLIQLAHQNYIEDFDLSYSFLVAAIEAMAQIAIKPEKYERHECHEDWKRDFKGEPLKSNCRMQQLFSEYKDLLEFVENDFNQTNLKKRFVSFILKYCPVRMWEDAVDEDLRATHIAYDDFEDHVGIVRSETEIPLNSMSMDDIDKAIKKTYVYRSGFFHNGRPLPLKPQQKIFTIGFLR